MAERSPATADGRRTIARHAHRGPQHPFLQILAMLAIALGVVSVSVIGVSAFAVVDAARAATENSIALGGEDQLPPTLGAIEGGVNMLLVGTDSCEGQDIALFPRCAEDEGGERNDVTMLVNISDSPRRVTVVSFPRDMIVPIPECTAADGEVYSAKTAQMINASYLEGGLGCSVATVEAMTDVDIQFAAAIRWTGVINLSDAIGGVDVCVSGDISDTHTRLSLTEGTHTLKGEQALQFLRMRHGIGDGSDLGRISNQQQFMSSMVRKLQSETVLSNPGTLFNIATTAIAQVNQKQLVLTQGLANPTRMVQIAMAMKDVPYEDIVFVQYPTVYGTGAQVNNLHPVREDADDLFAAIAANQPLTLTGEASGGFGVEVTDEATKPSPSASESPDPSASPSEPSSPSGSASPEERVELPSSITGTTAAQVTCTVPQG